MQIELTDRPNPDEQAFIVAQIRSFNSGFIERDMRSLCLFARDAEGCLHGGILGETGWDYLHISHLWVREQHRRQGLATRLVLAAEEEARIRGCRNAVVDTFSFQAPGFYRRLGYEEFGRLSGYAGEHERIFLRKELTGSGV